MFRYDVRNDSTKYYYIPGMLLIVSVDECVTGDVRLVGGLDNSSSGLLEVCINGVWGNVCDYLHEWNHENAAVVCRQLNLPTSSQCTK